MNDVAIWIRWALTATLLCIVWFHAHWSVALCLALLFINSELLALVARWRASLK